MSNDPATEQTTSNPRDPGLTTAAVLLATFAGMVLVAFGVMRFPGVFARGYQIPVDRVFFTIVNTATLAGFE
ncbi:MAG TPA: hypothetical protein PKB10_12030, partial [Tepidisphaeraceae bacterium]|nr:hypothetical protein [Tepidisphaeraceae bacterium]